MCSNIYCFIPRNMVVTRQVKSRADEHQHITYSKRILLLDLGLEEKYKALDSFPFCQQGIPILFSIGRLVLSI